MGRGGGREGYEKYGGERSGRDCKHGFDGRSGGNNEAGRGMGRLDGEQPGEGVESGRDTEVERSKGEIVFWKSARDIILVPTSDVVIRPGPTEHSVIESLAQAHTEVNFPFPPLPPSLRTHVLSPHPPSPSPIPLDYY